MQAQKDARIRELERQGAEMQARIEKVMQKVYNPQAQEVVKGLRKESGQTENVVVRKQEISMSRGFPSDSQNFDPNREDLLLTNQQQNIWAEELRRADERVQRFKQDASASERRLSEAEVKLKELEKGLLAREQEIHRLGQLYRGGQNFDQVKLTFDKTSLTDQISLLT